MDINSASIEYCRQAYKTEDYEHYLISLMMTKRLRPSLWSIGAFQSVIENIPAQVSEPTLGLIRLTWWRDQIILLGEGKVTQGQPVLSALQETVQPENFPLLIEFINEQENIFEGGDVKPSSVIPRIHQEVIGSEYTRFLSLQNSLTKLLKKYHGTRWEKHPPFLAIRLYLASLIQ